MKPGSGSPFFRSVPYGEPECKAETRTSLVVHASHAPDECVNVSGRLALHDRSFGEFPVFHVAPERNEQLARQRDNPNASQPTTTPSELALIPLREGAGWLVPDPAPGQLHHEAPHMFIAGARDALIVCTLAALIRGRYQTHQAGQLPPVLNLPPPKDFCGQHPGADGADPTQGGQRLDISAQCGSRVRGERGALGVQVCKHAGQKLELRPSPLKAGFQPCGVGWQTGLALCFSACLETNTVLITAKLT